MENTLSVLNLTSFSRYVKAVGDEYVEVKAGRKPVFTAAMENTLVEYCLEMERRFFGLARVDIRRLAFRIAEVNGIAHSFSKVAGQAGKSEVYENNQCRKKNPCVH